MNGGKEYFSFPHKTHPLPPPAVAFYHFINSTHLQLDFAWWFWFRCHKSVFLKRKENPEFSQLLFWFSSSSIINCLALWTWHCSWRQFWGYQRSLYSLVCPVPWYGLLVHPASYLNPCRKHLCFITFAYTLFISFKKDFESAYSSKTKTETGPFKRSIKRRTTRINLILESDI